jgi:hypothetical protein
MRRIVLTVVACCAVIAIVPASALAHGDHHKRQHHRGHHGRVRDESWGGGTQSQGTGQSQDAGTVQSFTGGVLTIALTGGQTVSGQVTNDTEIECQAAEESSGSWQSHDHGGDNGGGSSGDDDQGQGDDDNGNASCDSSALTPGAMVHEASLRISSAGAVWDKVELATQSSQSSTGSDS